MRAVVQRVSRARVDVGGATVAAFEGPGLVVLVGVTHTDTPAVAHRLATKVLELRIFEPRHGGTPDGPRELSALELAVPVIVVSQFTLYGDTRKGRRPTWTAAAPGPVAEPLVAGVVAAMRDRGAVVGSGTFGADMLVDLVNDGPMTVVVDVD